MKYLEVEGAGRLEAEQRGGAVGHHVEASLISDLIWSISDLWCPICSGTQVWGSITDDRCALELAPSVGCCHSWLMRFFISVFALLDESDVYIGFWFVCLFVVGFFFFFWESVGLLLYVIYSFLCWAFFPWLACSVTIFFLQILAQNFFLGFFFLFESRTNNFFFYIYIWGCS